jgi:hypothetical protein
MPGFTQRNVLKSGAALAGGGVFTALSPDFVRGATDLLILAQQGPNLRTASETSLVVNPRPRIVMEGFS